MSTGPWQVTIHGGATDVNASAPVKFGTPTITVGNDGLSPTFVPLMYGPVYLRSVDDWLVIEVPNDITAEETTRLLRENGMVNTGPKKLRVMDHMHRVEFTDWGEIRITGLEAREDGTAVFAVWLVDKYFSEPDAPPEAGQ